MHEETTSHFLTCDKNPQLQPSLAIFSSKVMGKEDDPHPLRYLLVAGIQHWTAGSSSPFKPDVTQYAPHLREGIADALRLQDILGWDMAVKGFLSKAWNKLAQMDNITNRRPDSQQAASRMRQCLSALHEHTHRLWKSRNEILHSTSDAALTEIMSSELTEIRHYHANPELLCVGDLHYCERSLENLLKGSGSTRRPWLRRVRASCEAYKKSTSGQRVITQFFAPAKSTAATV